MILVTKTSDQTRQRGVCVCVCVFIKLHITTQSGPVILVILCHSHWSSRGGINDTYYENLWSDATKGTRSLYLYNSYLSSEFLVCVCVFMCVCVFIKLHITTQSGPVILVILCHSHWSSRGGINDTLCVCVFIKLHITAQSGLVIVVILCHSRWSSQGGINDTCYESLWSNACVCVSVCFRPIYSGHQSTPFGMSGRTSQGWSHRRKVTQEFSSTHLLRCLP